MRDYRPRVDDFFPSRARGTSYKDKTPAVAADGARPGKEQNVKDWKAERGFNEDRPLDQCIGRVR